MLVHFETFAKMNSKVIFALQDNNGCLVSEDLWNKLETFARPVHQYVYNKVTVMQEWIVSVNNCTPEEYIEGYPRNNSDELRDFLAEHIDDISTPEDMVEENQIKFEMEFDALWK